ncbi:MAG TPA: glycosyltransferase family 2 protein [Puia sp.]|nr:glycosyltransferase family 2 protein [Puia sp.]
MDRPLVSVLMTAYNREKYIREAIESVLASTYPNFELVIVDDASSDGTVAIAQEYAARDERIRLFVNPTNLGQFENRNLAARLSKGKYLKYLDSDDLLYPTGLDVLVSMMERFPEAGYGLCSLIQDDRRPYPFLLTPEQAYRRHFIEGVPIFQKAPLSSIIKRTAYDAVGGFTNPQGEGDYEMWLQLSLAHQVVLMPDGVVWYRVHEEQIDVNRRNNPLVRFRYFLVTLKYMNGPNPLPPEEVRSAVAETHREMVKYIARAFVRHSPAKAREMYRAGAYNTGKFLRHCVDAARHKFS